MSIIKTKDGTEIYYKDWGQGRPVVFSHGWPLSADAWDPQMLFLGQNGYRVIAHDRRGHGRSSQPWNGNDMDTYADDLAALVEALDLKDATLVGHSTGGGEVARYIGRHGSGRVAGAVLIGAVPPLMLKTANNPGGLPISAFDEIRDALFADRSQFFKDLSMPFYGYNKPVKNPFSKPITHSSERPSQSIRPPMPPPEPQTSRPIHLRRPFYDRGKLPADLDQTTTAAPKRVFTHS